MLRGQGGTSGMDAFQVIDIPPPGGQLTRRVAANANNSPLLNWLPTFLNNNTYSVTAPIETGGSGSANGTHPFVVNLPLG
jgi:hypothetical protein